MPRRTMAAEAVVAAVVVADVITNSISTITIRRVGRYLRHRPSQVRLLEGTVNNINSSR